MAIKKIGATIALDGEKEFRSAITAINAGMKTMTSEMRLVSSQYKTNQNSIEALTAKNKVLTAQYDSQKDKVGIYQSALSRVTQSEEKAANKVSDLKNKLAEAKTKMSEMEKSSDSTSKELDEQQKVISSLESELKKAETGYTAAEKNTAKWQTSLNNAEAELSDLDAELKKNDAYLDEAQTSTTQVANSIDEYGDEVDDAKDKTSTFGDVLKANLTSAVIISAVKSLANGVKEISAKVLQVGSDFDYAMSGVQSLCGATGQDFEDLKEIAKRMGAETKFTATQAAEGLQYMALAGWSCKEMLDGLEGVVTLAAAADMDLASASDILTDAVTALGDSAQDCNRYADVLAKTQASSNTTVAKLGESFVNCAATAGAYGYSLEDVATSLGVMANAGIKGSMAGTNLSIIMSRLATNTNGARDQLEDLGISFYDNQGNARDLGSVITELCDATQGMNDKQKAAIVTNIAGKNAQKSLNTILNQGSGAFNDLRETLENCDGAAKQMAATMQDNLKGDITILQSATEALGITVYEKFEGAFRSATTGITSLNRELKSGGLGRSVDKLADSFAAATEDIIAFAEDALEAAIDGLTWVINNADIIGGVLTGIGAGLLVFNVAPTIVATVTAVKAFVTATQTAGVAQAAFNLIANANPYVLLATAIGGVVAAFAIFGSAGEEAKTDTDLLIESTKELNDTMQATAETATETSKSWGETTTSLDAQGQAARNLAGKLLELDAQTDKTRATKQRMSNIVEQLNELVPGLTLSIDEETGALNQSEEAIYKAITANEAYNKAKAAQEKLSEITSRQVDAEIQLAEAEEALAEIATELEAVEKERTRILEESKDGYIEIDGVVQNVTWALGDLADKEYELTQSQKETGESITTLQESYDGLNDTYDTVYDYMETQIEESGYVADAYGSTGEAADGAATATEDAMESMTTSVEEATASIVEDIADQIDMFSEFDGKMELSTEKMLSNMQSQIDGVTNWSSNIQTLADRGINEGLLQYLADMGPEGAGYVATFATMTDEELQKANELWEQSLSLADTAGAEIAEATGVMVEGLDEMAEEGAAAGEEVGKNVITGYGTGINAYSNEARQAMIDTNKLLLNEPIFTFGIHSPSTVFAGFGQNLMEGMAQGITGKKEDPLSAMSAFLLSMLSSTNSTLGTSGGASSVFQTIGSALMSGLGSGVSLNSQTPTTEISTVASNVVSTVQQGLTWDSFSSIGSSIISGLTSGISNGASSVVTAIANVCSNAIQAAKNALGINSPSKVFKELGKFTAQGFSLGYEDEMPAVNQMIADSVEIPSFVSAQLSLAGGSMGTSHDDMDMFSVLREYLPYLKAIAEKDTDVYLNNMKLTNQMDRSLGKRQKFVERG